MPGKPRLSKEEAQAIIANAKANGVNDPQDFKRLLSALRVQQGMTLEYLAANMNVSLSNLAQYIDPKQSVRMPKDVFTRYLEALELGPLEKKQITVIAERGGFLGQISLDGRSAASVAYIERFMRGDLKIDSKEKFADLIENFKLRHHQRTGTSMKAIDAAVGVQISHYSQKYNNISQETLEKFLEVVQASEAEKSAVMELAQREGFLADPYRVKGGKRAWETRRTWEQRETEEECHRRCDRHRDGSGNSPDEQNGRRSPRARPLGAAALNDEFMPRFAFVHIAEEDVPDHGLPIAVAQMALQAIADPTRGN